MILYFFLLFFSGLSFADTIDNYIHISNTIPQMEMKADMQSQAWARSARNVLVMASESIAETLLQANELAKQQGHPLFCLKSGVTLDFSTLDALIRETYQALSSQQSDKNKLTVSQVAWLGITKRYPCPKASPYAKVAGMQHAQGDLEQP